MGFEPLEALRVLAEYGHAGTHAIVNEVAVPPIGVLMGRTKYPAMDGSWRILARSRRGR